MAKIQLLNVQFTNVSLDTDSFEPNATDELNEPELTVNFLGGGPENPNHFAIRFKIRIYSHDITINVTSVAHFLSSEIVSKEFSESDFAMVNAPAIAYPYVRSFISNLTLLSGYHPVFLPTFNFVAMAESKKKRELRKIEKKKLKNQSE